MSGSPIRAIVIDDVPGTLRELQRLSGERVEFIAGYPNVEAFQADIGAHDAADVIVLDMHIAPAAGLRRPLMGASAIVRVKRLIGATHQVAADDTPKIVVFTSEHRPQILIQLLGFGVDGIASKQSLDPEDILDAIEAAAAGRMHMPAEVAGWAYMFQKKGKLPTLKDEHREIFRMKAQGMTEQAIAAHTIFSPKTVTRYYAASMEKLTDFLQEITGLAQLIDGVPDPNAERHSAAAIARFFGFEDGGLLEEPDRGQ